MRWRFIAKEQRPVAQKPHRCSGCRHLIHPGDKYSRLEGVCIDTWTTWKDCGRCVILEDNISGGWVRPVDALKKHPHQFIDFDGARLKMLGHRPGGNRQVYYAELIPRCGLTEWYAV